MNGREINKSKAQQSIKKLFELTHSTALAVQKAKANLDRKQVADIKGRLDLVIAELELLINILNTNTNERTSAQDKIDSIKNIQGSIITHIQRILGYDIVKENYSNQDDFRILTISTIPSSSSAEPPADYALQKLSLSIDQILNKYDINDPKIQAKINFNLNFLDELIPAFETEKQFKARLLDRQKKIRDTQAKIASTKTEIETVLNNNDLITSLQERLNGYTEHLNLLLKHQIEDIGKRVDYLSDQIDKLTTQQEKLQHKLDQAQANLNALKLNETETTDQAQVIRDDIKTLNKHLKENAATIRALQIQKDKLLDEIERLKSEAPNEPAPPAPPQPMTTPVSTNYKFADLDARFANGAYENYLVSAMHRLGLIFDPNGPQPFGANGMDRLVLTRDTSIIADLRGNETIQDEVFSHIKPEYKEIKKQLLAYKDFLQNQQNQSTDAKEIATIRKKLNRVALYLGAVARGKTSIAHLKDHLQNHPEQAFYYSKATQIKEGANDEERFENSKKKVATILGVVTPEPVAVIESGGTVKRNLLLPRSLKENPVVIESEFLDANNVPIKTAALMHIKKHANNTDKVHLSVFVKSKAELKRLADIPDQGNLPGDEVLKFALSHLLNASAAAGKNLNLNLSDKIIGDFPENVNRALFITAKYLNLNIESQNLLPAVSDPGQYVDALERRLATGAFFADERSAVGFATRRALAKEITGQTNFVPYPFRFQAIESNVSENKEQQAAEKPLSDLLLTIPQNPVTYTREAFLPFSSKSETATSGPALERTKGQGRPTRNILGTLKETRVSAVQKLYDAWNRNKQKKQEEITKNFNRLAAYDPGFPLEPNAENAQQVFNDIMETLRQLTSETELKKIEQVKNYAANIENVKTEKEQQHLILNLDHYVKTQFPLLVKFGKQIDIFYNVDPTLRAIIDKGKYAEEDDLLGVLNGKDFTLTGYMSVYIAQDETHAFDLFNSLNEVSNIFSQLIPLNIDSCDKKIPYITTFAAAIDFYEKVKNGTITLKEKIELNLENPIAFLANEYKAVIRMIRFASNAEPFISMFKISERIIILEDATLEQLQNYLREFQSKARDYLSNSPEEDENKSVEFANLLLKLNPNDAVSASENLGKLYEFITAHPALAHAETTKPEKEYFPRAYADWQQFNKAKLAASTSEATSYTTNAEGEQSSPLSHRRGSQE